jgi:hypothetical protein
VGTGGGRYGTYAGFETAAAYWYGARVRSPRLTISGALLMLLLLAAWTSAAGAATFCVSDPTCPAGGTREATVRAAFTDAARTVERDRVQIGPGTFTEDNLVTTSSVDVVGAGSDRTTLVPSGGTTTTLNLASSDSTVSDLTVQVPTASGAAGLLMSGTTATRVAVTGSGLTNATGVVFSFGGRFANGSIDLTGTPTTTGVSSGAFGGGLVTDSRIAAPIGDTDVRLQRVRIVASALGVSTSPSLVVPSSSLTLEDVLVQLTAVGAIGVRESASANFLGSASASLTLRHVTVVGIGDGTSVGVQATAAGTIDFGGRPVPGNVTATLSSTLVTGVGKPIDASLTGAGSALVLSDFSDWDPRAASSTGGAQVVRGTHDLNVLPGFANAPGSDFSLVAGSPLVDRGDPALAAGESATDAAGAPRIVDGNGDGTASSDIGAFEYQPPRPPGQGGGGGGGGNPADAPTLGGLKLSHTRFAVAAGATARAAARRRRALLRPPRGTTISFTLSRPAAVTITVERKLHGLRRGRSCVAPTRRLRGARARACTRFTTAFTFTRGGAAGGNSLPFSGRAGRRALPAGSYRLGAVAKADGRASPAARPVAFAIVRG